jgi:hypothetical protein
LLHYAYKNHSVTSRKDGKSERRKSPEVWKEFFFRTFQTSRLSDLKL